MSFTEIEDLLLAYNPEAASKLIDQLPEDQSNFKIIFNAEILRIKGNIVDSKKTCDSIIFADPEKNVSDLQKFIAKTIKAYCLYRSSEFEECDKLLINTEAMYNSLTEGEQTEFIVWFATLLQVKGNMEIEKGLVLNSIKNWEDAIQIYKEIKREGRIPGLLSNIGLHYSYFGQIDEGLEYLRKAEKLIDNRLARHPEGIPNDKFYIKLQLGRAHTLMGDFTKAIDYLKESLDISYELNNLDFQYSSQGNLFYTLMQLGDKESAKVYLDSIFDLFEANESMYKTPMLDFLRAMYLQSSKKTKNVIEAQILLEKIVYEDQISVGLSNSATILLVEILLEELKSYGEKDVLDEIVHLTERIEVSAEMTHSNILAIQTMLLKSKLSLINGEIVQSNNLLDKAEELAHQNQLDLFTKQIQTEKEKMRSDIYKWEEMIGRGASIKEKMDLINYQEYIDIAKKYVESV
ncbi:MAG: tetratricopeptide repeat protein [Candidatus Kariarchaeaceae archaeon]